MTSGEIFQSIFGVCSALFSGCFIIICYFLKRSFSKLDMIDPMGAQIDKIAERLEDIMLKINQVQGLRTEIDRLKDRLNLLTATRHGKNGELVDQEDL